MSFAAVGIVMSITWEKKSINLYNIRFFANAQNDKKEFIYDYII